MVGGISGRPGEQLSGAIPRQDEGSVQPVQCSQTLAEKQLTAIGVIAPGTSTQTVTPRGPWHERGTCIQKGRRLQPSPKRRLLNFTAVNRQHPINATSASVANQLC